MCSFRPSQTFIVSTWELTKKYRPRPGRRSHSYIIPICFSVLSLSACRFSLRTRNRSSTSALPRSAGARSLAPFPSPPQTATAPVNTQTLYLFLHLNCPLLISPVDMTCSHYAFYGTISIPPSRIVTCFYCLVVFFPAAHLFASPALIFGALTLRFMWNCELGVWGLGVLKRKRGRSGKCETWFN